MDMIFIQNMTFSVQDVYCNLLSNNSNLLCFSCVVLAQKVKQMALCSVAGPMKACIVFATG